MGLWPVVSQGYSVLGGFPGEHFPHSISCTRSSSFKIYIYSFQHHCYLNMLLYLQEPAPTYSKMRPILHGLLPPLPPSRATYPLKFNFKQELLVFYAPIWCLYFIGGTKNRQVSPSIFGVPPLIPSGPPTFILASHHPLYSLGMIYICL